MNFCNSVQQRPGSGWRSDRCCGAIGGHRQAWTASNKEKLVEMSDILMSTSGLLFGLLALIIALLWIFVPFAIFGVKSLLRDILIELRRANELTEAQMMADRDPYALENAPAGATERQGMLANMRDAVRQADRR